MIDILLFLFQNYADFSAPPRGEALARKLSASGFESEEVSAAVEWLATLCDEPTPLTPHAGPTQRIYTAEEAACLRQEGIGLLVFLETAGAIDTTLRELIIGRALGLETESLPLAQLKIIILIVLWSRDLPLDPLIVGELLADDAHATIH